MPAQVRACVGGNQSPSLTSVSPLHVSKLEGKHPGEGRRLLQLGTGGACEARVAVPAGELLHVLKGTAYTPPRHTYLTSRYSSMPYLEPSRPRPDCFTPPNGHSTADSSPSLTPTMPTSSRSATRQIWAGSWE